VKKTETVTLDAIKKELALERLLEKEEEQKEEIELEEVNAQFENEKKER